MDLTSKLAAQPGAEPVPGVLDAWHWSRMIFSFDAVVSGDRVLEMRVMGEYDPALARAVLELARDHSEQLLDGDRPLVTLDGLACPGWDFDTVAAVGPEVHEYHSQEDTDLHKATVALFPAWRQEFAGSESLAEARHQFDRGLQPTRLRRDPVPFLRMRYRNERTGSHSEGPDRGLATLDVLRHELSLLPGAPGSHVEWENRLGAIFRAEYDDTLTVHGPHGPIRTTGDDLVALADQSVLRPEEAV
ncbi:hypothetical protein [Streptomyces noursei]|uniref:hypothetical protein n=1 Tax=Streptomyces noursei TaxID=1971 RepID=UPI000C9D1E74|nr:hypothetical protein [Streptomyces noursei]